MKIRVNLNSGELFLAGFIISKETTKEVIKEKIISTGGEFKFSYKNGDEETFVINFNDNEFVYTIRFNQTKIVLFTIEYLDFATDFESYIEKKDNRIARTKEIISELGVQEQNTYPWGEIKYFYEPRSQTPMIMFKYNN